MFPILSRAKSLRDVAPEIPFAEQKKRVKIVVIDDDPHSFPAELLRQDGYTIDDWTHVDSSKLQRLENADYDIIILDIQGITDATVSDTGDGLGVLKRVKAVNPSQVVVAFSGSSYDLSKVPFWKIADDVLQKPVSLIACKDLLDGLIKKQISPTAYWDSIARLLKKRGVPDKQINLLERRVIAAAEKGTQLGHDELYKLVGKAAVTGGALVSLVNKLLVLWTHFAR